MARAIVIGILALLAALGLYTGSFAPVGLVLAVLAAAALIALADRLLRKKVFVTLQMRTAPGRPGRADCEAVFHNTGHFPVLLLTADIRVANRYNGETAVTRVRTFLAPRGTAEVRIEIAGSHCGKITAYAEKLRLWDPLGLFGVRVPEEAQDRKSVV